jgi:hypothetical protein
MDSIVVADAVSHDPSAELKRYLVDISCPTLQVSASPTTADKRGKEDGS